MRGNVEARRHWTSAHIRSPNGAATPWWVEVRRAFWMAIALLACAVPLAGCDGHARGLDIHDRADPKPPWLLTVIENESDRDVPTIVRQVALDLGLKPSEHRENAYFVVFENHQSFQLRLSRDDRRHVWMIALIDWPTILRSDVSRRVESRLREALAASK